MKIQMRRLLAMVMALMLGLTTLPFGALAQEEQTIELTQEQLEEMLILEEEPDAEEEPAMELSESTESTSKDEEIVDEATVETEPAPTAEATVEIEPEATAEPTAEGETESTAEPTLEPEIEATIGPEEEASTEPTVEATLAPEVSVEASVEPSAEVTIEPPFQIDDALDDSGSGPSGSGSSADPKTLADFGIDMPAEAQTRASGSPSYLHPQTLVISRDNENNYHTGYSDNDLHNYLYSTARNAPIEVRFDLETLPARNAYLAINAWDCDEANGKTPEYDAVYVNGHKVGVMTGENQEWNTTLIPVPVSYLKEGANYVTIHIGIWEPATGVIIEDYYWWAIEVNWVQLILDGGSSASRPEVFSVTIKLAESICPTKPAFTT